MTQQELDFTRYPERAGAKDMDTGRAAANAIEGSGRAPLLRDRVLEVFARGYRLTADEVAAKLDEDILSIRPRVSELFKQHKLLDTGERRLNTRGRPAKVLRINPLSESH